MPLFKHLVMRKCKNSALCTVSLALWVSMAVLSALSVTQIIQELHDDPQRDTVTYAAWLKAKRAAAAAGG